MWERRRWDNRGVASCPVILVRESKDYRKFAQDGEATKCKQQQLKQQQQQQQQQRLKEEQTFWRVSSETASASPWVVEFAPLITTTTLFSPRLRMIMSDNSVCAIFQIQIQRQRQYKEYADHDHNTVFTETVCAIRHC